jgi:hypothetical protein
MNITKLLLTVASIAILGTSCTPEKQGVKQYDYTYTNKTGKDVTVNIYKTWADYNSESNVYITGVAPANGGTFVVPSSDFSPGVKYYVDWYSADRTYTNWQNRQSFYDEFNTSFVPTYQNNKNPLESVNDYARPMFIGNGLASTWVAVDGVAYPGGNTTEWADLPESYKYRKITFKKDFSCVYYYQNDTSGIILNNLRTYRTPYLGTSPGMSQGMIYINIEDQHEVSNEGIVTYTIGSVDENTGLPTFGDTIVLDMEDEGRYMMVRETSNKKK